MKDKIKEIAEKHATFEDANLLSTIDMVISQRVEAAIREALSAQWVDSEAGQYKRWLEEQFYQIEVEQRKKINLKYNEGYRHGLLHFEQFLINIEPPKQ